nr:hypothetical protein [Tanacetum cinerariifolium]
MTPSTIAIITTSSEVPIPPTTIPSAVLKNLLTFDSVFRFEDRVKSLEVNFSEFMQTNQFAEAVSKIPVDLIEMELKKIFIEKMEGNKSIQRSDEQRNLYKALVDAYEADKNILESYGDTAILKRRHRVKSLEVNFSEFMRTNKSTEAVSNILGIVHQYMHQEMMEAIREAVQIQTDRLQDSIQRENDEFLRTIDDNIKKIIKEQAEVLTRSSHSSRTSYAVAADLLEMELKKILIDKMEGNKSIQRSDEQRNLYKALVEAYEADKTILDSYGESAILKRRREDADDQERPSAGSDWGSKRRREGGEHASASTPSKPATGSTCRSTTGTQSRQLSATVQRNAQSWISALAK